MIHAIAIDDEPLALELIESYCKSINMIQLDKVFTKVREAERHVRKFPVDLLILDINMPEISGIEFLKKVQQETMVIFTTAYSEHAIEAFDLNAVDYILKPFSLDRFEQAIRKAVEYYNFAHRQIDTPSKFIYLKADYSLIKIELETIRYIEAFADYLKIYLPNNKAITIRLTMKTMMEKLPEGMFIRIHRSYIVPKHKIQSYRNRIIVLEDVELPVGVSYIEELNKLHFDPGH